MVQYVYKAKPTRGQEFDPDQLEEIDQDAATKKHVLLDGNIHTDTTLATFETGDIVYRDASGKWIRLAKGSDDQVLTLEGGVPVWKTPTAGGGGAKIQVIEYTGDGSYPHRIIATTFTPKLAYFLRHDDYMFSGRVVYQSEDGRWGKAADSDNTRDLSTLGDGTPIFTAAGVDVGRIYDLWNVGNIENVDYTLFVIG